MKLDIELNKLEDELDKLETKPPPLKLDIELEIELDIELETKPPPVYPADFLALADTSAPILSSSA